VVPCCWRATSPFSAPTSSCTAAGSKTKQGRGRRSVGEQEQILERSPAAQVRRPKQDYESRTLGLDRNELGAFLVATELSSNRDHALASMLALDGLRISEALGADIEQLNVERGHRTLRIVRKGGKQVTIPLPPRTARAIDLAIGERGHGPILLGAW